MGRSTLLCESCAYRFHYDPKDLHVCCEICGQRYAYKDDRWVAE